MSTPSRAELLAELAALGRAGPTAWEPVGPPDSGWRLRFDEGDDLLLLGCAPSRYHSLQHADAAHALVAELLPLPPVRSVVAGQWLLRSPRAGKPATHPARFAPTARTVLRALATVTVPRVPGFGHWPGHGTFWPESGSWSAAVVARAHFLAERAREEGCDGALTDEALACVRARAEALDGCPRFSLVHGALSPLQTLVHEDGRLAMVLDWSRAHLGDPVEDLVRYLIGPEGVARAFAEAFGPLDPGALRRLEAYHASHALELAAEGGSAPRAAAARLAARTQLDAARSGWTTALFAARPLPVRRPAPAWTRTAVTALELALTGPPEDARWLVGAAAGTVVGARIAARGNATLARALLARVDAALGVVTTHARGPASGPTPADDAVLPLDGTAAELAWVAGHLGPFRPGVERIRAARTRLRAVDALLTGGEPLVERLIGAAAAEGVGGSTLAAACAAKGLAPPADAPDPVDEIVGRLVELRSFEVGHWRLVTLLLALDDLARVLGPVVRADVVLGWFGMGPRVDRGAPVVAGVAPPRILVVAPAPTGWGELTLGLRVVESLVAAGMSCTFSVDDSLIPGLRARGFSARRFPQATGAALVESLRHLVESFDAWVLVDLYLGGTRLLDRGVEPRSCVAVGPPLIGIDTWDYRAIGQGLDLSEYARSRVNHHTWSTLERRLVPVPFARWDTADACNLLPVSTTPELEPARVRSELGVGDRKLLLLCTSFWQHERLALRETADAVSLLSWHLRALDCDWTLVHVGPRDLSLAGDLGDRYVRLGALPVEKFEQVVRAADLVVSLNASATTNTTAVTLGTPVLTLVQRLAITTPAQLESITGRPCSAFVGDWILRHAPVQRFLMWPMCMVSALGPHVTDTPYGSLLHLTEILDEGSVQERMSALLFDRGATRGSGEAYVARVRQLPDPATLVRRHL
jgi:hypothetical protein